MEGGIMVIVKSLVYVGGKRKLFGLELLVDEGFFMEGVFVREEGYLERGIVGFRFRLVRDLGRVFIVLVMMFFMVFVRVVVMLNFLLLRMCMAILKSFFILFSTLFDGIRILLKYIFVVFEVLMFIFFLGGSL